MHCTPIKIRALVPPRDSLVAALRVSKLKLREGDVLAISSKVVGIDEGRCISVEKANKEDLVKKESQLYFHPKRTRRWGYKFTITHGVFGGSAGIDKSNGNGYFILWPKNPMRSAKRLRAELQKMYGVKNLGIIITDSTSRPLRRGAIGFALAWDGVEALYDYRGEKDIFGRPIKVEQANLVDALAATAVFMMGEGSEQTPICLLRDMPPRIFKSRHSDRGWHKLVVPLEDDLFAPFLTKVKWQKGGAQRSKSTQR